MQGEIPVPGCSATTAELLLQADGVQILRVRVAVGGEIPTHAHDCAAAMFVVAGSATAVGEESRVVHAGDVVVKAKREPHGFTNVTAPFSFISVSSDGGILRDGGWDLQFAG